MHQKKQRIKDLKKDLEMKIKIILLIVFQFIYCYSFAVEYVNLKYLRSENIALEFQYDINCIKIKKNDKTVKIFLGSNFALADDTIIKLDYPPFSDNDNIFITQFTYNNIMEIFSGSFKKTNVVISRNDNLRKVRSKAVNDADMIKEEIKTLKESETREPQKIIVNDKTKKNEQKIIVIDPGHGGNDPGAIGKNLRVQEKDVVLNIGKRLKQRLEKERKNFKIILTREDDKFISLKERSLLANRLNATLFVSLHCNSSYNKSARGTRTYVYSRVASSKDAEEAAKFENRSVNVFEFLLNDLRKNAFEALSVEAAGHIQHSLAKILKFRWHPTERAPFYVLANTNMPSVLVEVAFISNNEEEKKLNSDYFCQQIADGIADGILEYFDKIQ